MCNSFLKLPENVELTLILIQTELKTRKFFNGLAKVGLDDCYLRPNLDSVIMQCLDMDDVEDETFLRYDGIMERGSWRVVDEEGVVRQALKVYRELLKAKERLSRKNN
ncbi:MAG TPA: hypothetical protein VK476_06795 [Flavobacterium sp.]|nr:hypothetical protein [Flavobacterium sp.]